MDQLTTVTKALQVLQAFSYEQPVMGVSELARKLQTEVITVTHLEVAPARWPDLANGRAVYKQCTTHAAMAVVVRRDDL